MVTKRRIETMDTVRLPLSQRRPSKKGDKFYSQVNRIFNSESKKNFLIRKCRNPKTQYRLYFR
jgi:hypothetical protein